MASSSTRSKRRRPGRKSTPKLFSIMCKDFVVSAVLPLLSILVAEISLGEHLTGYVDLPSEWIFISLILVMLIVLGWLSSSLDNALFNPADAAAAYAGGTITFNSAVLRSASQVAGVLSGVVVLHRFLPSSIAQRGQSLMPIMQPGIDPLGGASAEFLLTYLLSLLVFVITSRAGDHPLSRVFVFAAPLLATAAALHVGGRYTGPCLNPAAAFAWSYLHWEKQPLNGLEHAAVFWVAPIAAAVLAKWTAMGLEAARVNSIGGGGGGGKAKVE